MGRAMVEPVDDLSETNPGTHPELLEQLAGRFVTANCDLRQLIREIASSQTYQRSARPLTDNAGDTEFYSHRISHRLDAAVLADAIDDITRVPTQYGDQKPGTRAIWLTDSQVASITLDVLGRCPDLDTCESQGGSAADSLSAHLHLLNGPLLNDKLNAPSGRLQQWLRQGQSELEILERFTWLAFGRVPRAAEQEFWRQALSIETAGADERAAILQDLVWAMLVSNEFVTNH